MKIENFFAELKRRNVYKVAVAYAVVSWLLIQVATQVFPFFEVPNWAVRLVVLLLVLGFPVALILAWAFEITPEGIRRESDVATGESITRRTGRKLVAITAVLAVIAAGLFVFQFLRQAQPAAARQSDATPAPIETRGHDVVHRVVHRSDTVEHLADAFCRQRPALEVRSGDH